MIVVTGPEDQPVFFREVTPNPASGWRAGMDQFHPPEELAPAIIQLREKELAQYQLKVDYKDGQRRLITSKALKEHDVVGLATALNFSTPGLVRDFMNQGGNAVLMDGPVVHAKSLRASENGVELPHQSVYCVLVGAMNLLVDFREAGLKVPNCYIECRPECGASDGFLQVRIHTHNGCGVSAGSILVAKFGETYERSAPVMSPPCKKFRGSLDLVFGKPT